jgi:hypothetical protein
VSVSIGRRGRGSLHEQVRAANRLAAGTTSAGARERRRSGAGLVTLEHMAIQRMDHVGIVIELAKKLG